MSFKNIHFILVRPQMGENIGSVARAIKNFKISKLRIVNPRSGWPNQKAIATSVGAKNILQVSKIYNSLDRSIDDLDKSPVSLPSFVINNLSPEYPLNTGFDVTVPIEFTPMLD